MRLQLIALTALLSSACSSSHSTDDSAVPNMDGGTIPNIDGGPAMGHDGGPPALDASNIPRAFDGGPAYDVLFEGSSLAEQNGRTVWLRIHETVTSTDSPWYHTQVVNGGFELLIPGGLPQDFFGVEAFLFFDSSGEGTCNQGTDPAYTMFVSNTFSGPGPLVEPVPPQPPTPMWMSVDCATAMP